MQRLRLAVALLSVGSSLGTARIGAQSCGNRLQITPADRGAAASVAAQDLKVPDTAWKHLEKACVAVAANNHEAFEVESGKALASAPDLPQVYVLRAMLQVNEGLYEPAIASIARARTMRREVAWSTVVLASALNQLHRYDEAIADLGRARWDEMSTWQWSFERARAEVGRGNAAGALQWTEEALKAAPAARTEVKLLRADAFALAKRYAEAVEQLESYLASGPELRYREGARTLLARLRAKADEEAEAVVATR